MHFLTQWLLSSRSDVSSDRFTFKIILVETWVRSEKFTFKICMSWHFDTSTHYLNYRPCCFCLNIDASVVFFASDSFSSIYCAPEATKSSPHVAPVKKVFQHCAATNCMETRPSYMTSSSTTILLSCLLLLQHAPHKEIRDESRPVVSDFSFSILQFLLMSDECSELHIYGPRGRSQTTWTGFGTIFTPPLPLVNGHEHFDDPPLRTTWTFDDPPPLLHSP